MKQGREPINELWDTASHVQRQHESNEGSSEFHDEVSHFLSENETVLGEAEEPNAGKNSAQNDGAGCLAHGEHPQRQGPLDSSQMNPVAPTVLPSRDRSDARDTSRGRLAEDRRTIFG